MKLVGKITYGLFVTLLVAVAGLLLVSLLPITGNLEVKIVKSGSMEPNIKVGSLVVVVPGAHYAVGDVITFGKDTKTSIPTTHRILAVRQEDGQTFFTTKGDANEEQDPREVAANEVIGKVWLSVPFAGYVLDFARQPLGFALLIGVPAALIVVDEVATIFNEVRAMRRRRGKRGTPLLPLEVPQKPHVFRDRLPTI